MSLRALNKFQAKNYSSKEGGFTITLTLHTDALLSESYGGHTDGTKYYSSARMSICTARLKAKHGVDHAGYLDLARAQLTSWVIRCVGIPVAEPLALFFLLLS